MAKIEVGKGRGKVEQTNHGLRITIPSKKNFFLIVFMGFWLMGWAIGEVSVLKELLNLTDGVPEFFLIAWLGGWTVGGAFAIYAWLWNVMGKEIVDITSSELSHIKVLAGFNRSSEYAVSSISKLRLQPQNTSIFGSGNGMEFWGITGGSIAFDYGQSTHKFGAQLDEAEASHIIEAIKNRFTNL